MTERGAVHTYHAAFTARGPNGTRILKRTSTWYWRFYVRGKCHNGGPGQTTRAKARELGEKRKAEILAGLEEDWRKLTVQALYQMAQAPKIMWTEGTQVSFECAWRRIQAFFKPASLVMDIDDDALLRFVAFRRGQGAALNTVRLDLAHIRMAMRRAHGRRVLPFLPNFPRLKRERREQTVAHVELEQILARMPEHYRLLFECAEIMGWRTKSELRTRQWTHVEWGPPGWVVLEAQDSKTGERRVFPLTLRLRGVLERARARVETIQQRTGRIVQWVFCRNDGRPLGDYSKAWVRALRLLGIGKLAGRHGPWSNARVVHDIRRAAIRRFELVGVPRSTSMGLVGHSDERVFSGYAGRGGDPESLLRAAAILDAADAEAAKDERVIQLDLFKRQR